MTTVKFTDIKKNRDLVIQLWRNNFPTLAPIQWGDFQANNARTIQATVAADKKAWVLGGSSDQTITGVRRAVNNIDGAGGDDTIIGGMMDDYLYGGNGNDRLRGGEGSDRLSGGNGDDALLGDKGNDFIYGDDGNDFIEGGDGADTINGGEGADTIFGDNQNDTSQGSADVIFAGGGNDSVFGGVGHDFINGESGNDVIRGESGNDTLVGGLGNDTLSGGSGEDAFVFRLADAKNSSGQLFTDTITDFTIGQDKIWLDWTNYESTVTRTKPLEVKVSAVGNGTMLEFDFTSNRAGTDYRMILSNVSAGSLGSGNKLVENLNKMIVVYDNSDVQFG